VVIVAEEEAKVKVNGPTGPDAEALMVALHKALHETFVNVGVIVIGGGDVILKVGEGVTKHPFASLIVTVFEPEHKPVTPAVLPGPGVQV
jgi:hypothetical protein